MTHPALARRVCSWAFLCGALLLGTGCESDEGPSAYDRQEKAMKDPFSYGPDGSLVNGGKNDELDPTDISGGGTGTLDKKAFKRDLDAVFNP